MNANQERKLQFQKQRDAHLQNAIEHRQKEREARVMAEHFEHAAAMDQALIDDSDGPSSSVQTP